MNAPASAQSETIPCSRCGTPIDPQAALYGDTGQVCDACDASTAMADRIVRSCRSLSLSALGLGAVSIVFNPFLMATVMSIATAILAIRPFISGDEDDKAALRKHPYIVVVGVLAILLAGLRFVA